jgi:DNA mismatch repair protein MutS
VPPGHRAREVGARKLEKGRAETGGLAAGLGDLPLFAAAQEHREEQCDTLRDKLRDMDVDALSPRDALEVLYDLKREAGSDN